MIVTIDGPAGTGRASAARILAERLGFEFLNTGAMYRAVALACLERQIPPGDAPRVTDMTRQLAIRFKQTGILLRPRRHRRHRLGRGDAGRVGRRVDLCPHAARRTATGLCERGEPRDGRPRSGDDRFPARRMQILPHRVAGRAGRTPAEGTGRSGPRTDDGRTPGPADRCATAATKPAPAPCSNPPTTRFASTRRTCRRMRSWMNSFVTSARPHVTTPSRGW